MADERIDVGLFGDVRGLVRALDRVDRSLADVESEFDTAATSAFGAAAAFGTAESAADEFGDEIEETGRSLRGFTRDAGKAIASTVGLTGALSALGAVDPDIAIGPDHAGLAGLAGQVATTQAALSALDEFDTEGKKLSLAVDRSGLASALGGIDEETIDVNPVLRSLRGQVDADDVDVPRIGTDDPLSVATAMSALRSETDDLETSVASINREGDVDLTVEAAGLSETIGSLETADLRLDDLDGERARFSVDVDGVGSALAELEALEARAAAVDDLDVDVDADVDIDSSALRALRVGGGGFDLPDFDRRGREADSFSRGIRAVGSSLARLTRTSGAIQALAGLGPKASMGAISTAGGALTVGVSLVTAGVSGALGSIIGGGGLAAGIALPVFLNLDEREKTRLKQDILESLDPLRGGAWDTFATEITAEIPDITGEIAEALDASQPAIFRFSDRLLESIDANQDEIGSALSYSIDELAPEFGDLSVGFMESLPGIIRGTTDSARGLLSFIDDAARASGPLIDNLVTFGEGVGDVLGPLTVDFLDSLSAASPILGSIGEDLKVIGGLLQDINDLEQSIGGGDSGLVNLLTKIDAFEDAVFRAGEAVSVLRALSGGPLVSGPIIPQGWVQQLENFGNNFVELYNKLNDNPVARFLIPGMSLLGGNKDLERFDFTGYSRDEGTAADSGDGTDGGPAPPAAPASPGSEALARQIYSDMLADQGVSQTYGTGTGTPTPASAVTAIEEPTPATLPTSPVGPSATSPTTPGTAQARGSNQTQPVDNSVDVNIQNMNVGGAVSRVEARRIAERVHKSIERRQSKTQYGSGS